MTVDLQSYESRLGFKGAQNYSMMMSKLFMHGSNTATLLLQSGERTSSQQTAMVLQQIMQDQMLRNALALGH
jgi:hypothetical protein